MSRNLKRVPLDFSWPLNKNWEGYLNPHYRKCPACEAGYTVDRRYLQALVQLILVAGFDGLRGVKHPWLVNCGMCPAEPPTSEMAKLTSGLAGRDLSSLGHDALDRWATEKKIIEAAGLDPKTWGICQVCGGDAIDPAVRTAYEAWKEYDPPVGDGFQLWEDTSEGSPISQVFDTLDALCDWAETHATTFGSAKTSAAEWKRMLLDDHVYHQEGNMIFL
jgi:hypothetical protein